MKIDIDFDLLAQTKMSADDYTYLYIVYRKGFNYLQTLTLRPDLTALQHNGYITLGQTFDQHKVTDKFIQLFSSDFDQMFEELIEKYPMKVTSPARGVRILHAKDPNAKANEKSKNRYRRIVGTKIFKHNHIMNCLDNQLKVYATNLGYLQNLETWINNHTWEKYENLEDYDTGETTKRITRSL